MPSFMTFEQISRVLWIKRVDSPLYTAMFQAKNLGTLVLNHGHFEGNRAVSCGFYLNGSVI